MGGRGAHRVGHGERRRARRRARAVGDGRSGEHRIPIASKALEVLDAISGDRGAEPGAAGPERDLSVNHAFSQQFFEALQPGAPDDGDPPDARAAAES